MLGLTPVADPGAFIARRNPVVKLAVATLLSLTVLSSLDPLTPALVLLPVLALLPLTGVRVGRFAHRLRFLVPAAAAVVVMSAVFAADKTGRTLVEFGPVLVTASSLETGAALGLRVAAVAVPGVLIMATTDPTELADSLVRQLRVSDRFAIGALAALRLMPLLAEEWHMIRMARRARGMDSGGNPVTGARLFASTTFGLLVAAIRKGTRLATAMDARGFDSGVPRTGVRRVRVDAADRWMLAGVAAGCAVVLWTSIGLGVYRPLW
ncbi:energy-coupling factor transport system permease protein [Stackebrandtia albiflava]|uniref:Energy-coupling factor transport system permease protein n=1 Tax=Stackebrandtia albiflava TaxID=406432 RepID=A0A562VAX2_9ACTN|nr:energy-coupling factor transporter transmembrane component T [Stackebrandtia albiflava]TWJ14957.1 energy-coupling factor transport system permease protein [Stackebrandtia albiflava]